MTDLLRILLVEDNPGDAGVIEQILSKDDAKGFSIHCVTRLNTALEQVKTDAFDVILLDLGLPDSKGLDTLFTMKKGAANLPIVVDRKSTRLNSSH